jgi:thiol-disulfide isomerase/thioredoxin
LAWGAVGVILLGVIVLVVYALTRPSTSKEATAEATTSPGVLADVADVPASTFDAVGTVSPTYPLTPPSVVQGQPRLTLSGKPEVLYVGAEFCPFCAAERWPLIVALSRFGRFTTLYNAQSASNSVFPNLQTFSFSGATYVSRYLTFVGVELYSDTLTAEGTFTRIAGLTPDQSALVARYGTAGTTGAVANSPFVDIANVLVASTSGFSPVAITGQTQAAVAGDLAHADAPADPVGQAVVASANQLVAGMCTATDQQPVAVCSSKGVLEAASGLGLP